MHKLDLEWKLETKHKQEQEHDDMNTPTKPKPKRPERVERINVALDAKLHNRLKKLCTDYRCPITWGIDEAVGLYLAERDDGK